MATVFIILIFILPVLALPALILWLPWQASWRVTLAASTLLALRHLTTPPRTGANHVIEVLFANLWFGLILAGPSLALILKIVVLTDGRFWEPARHGPALPSSFIRNLLDRALTGLAAVMAAGWVMVGLSRLFQGAEQTILIHALLAVATGGLLVAGLRLRGLIRWSAALFATTLLSLTLLSLLAYPRLVLARADLAAKGGPYCISLPSRARIFAAAQDLSFLTIDKGKLYYQHPNAPHIALRLLDQPTLYWSFHQMAFLPLPDRPRNETHCP